MDNADQSMEDLMRFFEGCVPLDEIARFLGVNEGMFYRWVQSNGFEVIRVKGRGTVRPETAKAIVSEAQKQGFTNPTDIDKEVKVPKTVGMDEEGTLAYRRYHARPFVAPKKNMVKMEPTKERVFVHRSGPDGAIQPLDPS